VSGEDGLDEMSTSGDTHVVEVNGESVERYTVAPADVGLPQSDPAGVAGGTPAENAATTRAILAGEPGAPRDLALFNAGAAIYAAGVAQTLREGVEAAAAAVDDGAAGAALERYVSLSREVAG
jgi:anthranilate phosphoribosyltransferase